MGLREVVRGLVSPTPFMESCGHAPGDICHIFFGQNGGATQGKVCYQRCLPRLVFVKPRTVLNLRSVTLVFNA